MRHAIRRARNLNEDQLGRGEEKHKHENPSIHFRPTYNPYPK